jgi:hypothetical protein
VPSTELAGACATGSNPQVTLADVAAGTELFFFVEGTAGNSVFVEVTETPIRELIEGEQCDPQNPADVCVDPGTSCLGGPAPEPFTCTRFFRLGLGDSCVEGSTAAGCDPAPPLDCVGGRCVGLEQQIFAGALESSDPTWTRRDSSCSPSSTTSHYDVFSIGAAAGPARVLAFTRAPGDSSRCALDLFGHIFVSPFDPVAGTCIAGNDDGGPGLCPEIEFDLADGQVVDFVVSSFASTQVGPYELVVASFGSVTVTPQ